MLHAHHHLPQASAHPRPALTMICAACEAKIRLNAKEQAQGWTFETNDLCHLAYCPDCSRQPRSAAFEPSIYADDRPMAAVVHAHGRWFGLVHAESGRVLAHHFGEFGFWRVKATVQ